MLQILIWVTEKCNFSTVEWIFLKFQRAFRVSLTNLISLIKGLSNLWRFKLFHKHCRMCPVFWGTRSGRNWRTLGSGLLLSTVVAAVSSSDLFASKNTSTDFVLLRPIVVSSSNGFSMKTSTSSAYLGCRLNFFFLIFVGVLNCMLHCVPPLNAKAKIMRLNFLKWYFGLIIILTHFI